MKIDIQNQTDFAFYKDKLVKIASHLTNKDIELVICEDDFIQKLNNDYKKLDKPTDVLSFGYDDFCDVLGSIVVSFDFIKKGANRYGHTKESEFLLLFIHGLLHLTGYDHEIDKGEQREKEEELIKQFALPKSLIIRNVPIA